MHVVLGDQLAAELDARTELPSSSSRGDQTQMPIRPGTTSMSAPDTPLLAGRPMVNANSPEKSYMPQEDISDRQLCTVPGVVSFGLMRGTAQPAGVPPAKVG